MAQIAEAFVQIVPTTKGLSAGISKQFADVGGDAGRAMGGTLGAGFKSMIGPLVAAAGAVAVGGFLKSAVSGASDLAESANALKVTFGDAAGEVQKLGAAAATQMGLSNVQFNELAVRFSAFASTIAGPGGDVVGTLEDLTGRAADFASVMNLEVADAAQLFQSGLAGETEPLRKYGIDLSAAAVEAYAMANGIAKGTGELTEAEKVQARYGLLMEATSKAQGDFSNTSDGMANGLRILKATFTNVRDAIGGAFLPFVAMGVAALNSMLAPLQSSAQALTTWGDSIWKVFQEAGGGMAGFQAVFSNIFESIAAFFTGGGFIAALESMTEMRGVLIEKIMAALPGIIEAIIGFIPQLVTFITGTFIPAIVSQFVGIVTGIADILSTAIPALIGAIATAIPQIVTAITQLIPQLISTLVGMIPTLINAVISIVDSLVQAFVTMIPLLAETITTQLPIIIESIMSLLPMILEAAINLFSSLVTAVVTVLPMLITTIVGMLPSLLETILSMLPSLIMAAIQLFTGLLTGLVTALPTIIQALVDMIPTLIETLVSLIPTLIEGAIQLFLGIVTGLITAIPQIITALIDMLPQLITSLISMIPTLILGAIDLFLGIVTGLITAIPQIVQALIDAGPKMKDALLEAMPKLISAAKELIGGLVKGLADNGKKVFDKLVQIAKDAVGGVLDFLGIKSPSRLFISIGENVTQGLVDGLEAGEKQVGKAVDSLGNLVDSAFTPDMLTADMTAQARVIGGSLSGVQSQADVSTSQPIYTDGGTLLGWMKNVAGQQARIVWASADLENAVMV